MLEAIATKHSFALVAITITLMAVIGLGIDSIYTNYIYPLKKISSEALTIYSTNPSHRLKISGSKEISTLTEIINDFAEIFENLSKDITEQILSARKETEKERNLLAAIMAELPQGVIICNRSGGILLFNSRAKRLFSHSTYPSRADHFIGLGRSIFHLIDKELVAHAIEEIEERLNNNKESLASYFITPIYTGRLLSIETIPVLDQEKVMTGFILTFKDISDQVNQYENIDNTLLSFKQNMVSHFDQTKLFVKDLIEMPSSQKASHKVFRKKMLECYKQIENQLNDTSSSILDATITKVPLTKLLLSEFLIDIQKRAGEQNGIKINIKNEEPSKRMLADSYSLSVAFIFLIINLSEITNDKEYDLMVSFNNGQILFDIKWHSIPASQDQIENIFTKKIRSQPSFGYVLKQNRSEFDIISKDPQTCFQVRITAEAELQTDFKTKKRGAVIAESRPEFYDFDLFKVDDATKDIFNTDLRKIIFTVFDTETTGLDPDGGDEVISIAAVRIVNNRIVYQDIFEELVDPKRDIPIESYKIHGINYEMVKGKPDIETILPLFKIYTYDTVLLGHNIAFDMKMLKVKEESTNTAFSNLVLDTLLLSAAVYPINAHHDMESIAKRLGVNIIGRHTALGDAIATAEIFLKLVPFLNSNGIFTLKDALEASKKTYYSRLKY
ncbi:MAG: PAS domain-containing protein [Desulfobacteraceae bacterium]|nr:PAS domain-containing protein [Desulfobacteraceae bacterium]